MILTSLACVQIDHMPGSFFVQCDTAYVWCMYVNSFIRMYSAFGLTFQSFISLPELTETPAGHSRADVVIQRGPVALPFGVSSTGQECQYATEADAWFYWEEAGSFLVREGREILVDVREEIDPSTLRRYLLGPVLAMVMHQRGMLVLHGSAVAIDGVAVAFLGNSGLGKSTTAAALHARGHRLLADDIVAIDLSGAESPVLIPGFPELNLWPDVTAAVGLGGDSPTRQEEGREKRAFRADSSLLAPVPMHCLYHLAVSAMPRVDEVAPTLALMQIFNHSFGPVLRQFGLSASLFERCAEAARRIPMRCLTRTNSLAHLSELVRIIEEDTINASRFSFS